MFEELIAATAVALNEKRIPYMIIGGQAVLLYGTPRLTRDIDITLGIGVERLLEIVEVTRALKLKILPQDYKDFVQKTYVLPTEDPTSAIRVDFIFVFTPYEKQAIERAKVITIGGTAVQFASVEDMIIHKVIAGRPRDLEDARSMIIKHPNFDAGYVRRWLKEFDKTVEGQGLSKRFKELFN